MIAVVRDRALAKKQPNSVPHDQDRDRIDLRAEPAFVARVRRQAERLGMSLSAYLRMAATIQVERDEATDPERG